MSFEQEHEDRREEIRRLSRSQRIPGLTPEDVQAELVECLWRAWETFDPSMGLTLGRYWWAVWMSRKKDLLKAYFRQRRTLPEGWTQVEIEELIDTVPFLRQSDFPQCPEGPDLHLRIWRMLAVGYTGVEIRNALKISRRVFYDVLAGWRTSDVRTLLI